MGDTSAKGRPLPTGVERFLDEIPSHVHFLREGLKPDILVISYTRTRTITKALFKVFYDAKSSYQIA